MSEMVFNYGRVRRDNKPSLKPRAIPGSLSLVRYEMSSNCCFIRTLVQECTGTSLNAAKSRSGVRDYAEMMISVKLDLSFPESQVHPA